MWEEVQEPQSSRSGKRSVDVAPHLVGIVNQFAIRVRNLLGQRHENLLLGQFHCRRILRCSKGQAIKADFDFNNLGHAILGAILEFALLDAARGIGQVRAVFTDTGAEQLHAAAGSG